MDELQDLKDRMERERPVQWEELPDGVGQSPVQGVPEVGVLLRRALLQGTARPHQGADVPDGALIFTAFLFTSPETL